MPHVRVEVLSQPRYLSGARDLVAAVAKRFGFDDTECGRIALAVDEALCNVIKHGYDRRPDGKIWISIWPLVSDDEALHDDAPARGVRLVIEDEAKQIDPAQIRSRDLDEIRPGGLGVHIIQQVMDRVEYARRRGGGMRLEMIKQIAGPEAGSDSEHAPGASADAKEGS